MNNSAPPLKNGRNGDHPTWKWVGGLAGSIIVILAALFANAVISRLDENTAELRELHRTLGVIQSDLSDLRARVEERGKIILENSQRIRELERENRKN